MAVNIKANDQEILWTPPQTSTEARVPTAEELAASSHLHQQNLTKAIANERPAGLKNRPTFTAATKNVTIPANTLVHAPGHPAISSIPATTITLPNLADTVSTISRYDYIYLLCFGVEVTAAIDSDINLPFEWKTPGGTIQTLTQENTRRIRSVWAIVASQGATTASAIYSALTTAGTNKTLTVTKALTGTALGTTRIYPLDANLADTATYVVREDSMVLIDLVRVWRSQVFSQNGYLWGRTGEANFDAEFVLQPTYRYVGDGYDNWELRAEETLKRVMLGLPVATSPGRDRAVQNLLNGQVGANLDAPGIATASPNGSTAIANNQRVSFTNQAITQKTYVLPITTSNAGGFAQASAPFQTNSPSGSFFSTNLADHRVYNVNGVDITANGSLTGLGSTGALVWTAYNSAAAAVGDLVYIQAAIVYPSGSGFAFTGDIEKVFLDNVQIGAANVREAGNDPDAYTAPANGESFIVVLGKERAALHYIYKRVTVTSSSSGVVALPSTERGAIAFISGTSAPTGRIDSPVVTGLANSSSYNLLVYYPPRSTENWQFQFKTSAYAGTGERTLLDGSTIATQPSAIAHTQGGGNGVFLADGEFQYEAIAFRLPANTLAGSTKHHQANYKIQFSYEGDLSAASVREVGLSPAAGLVLPRVGLVLTCPAGGSAQGKGISGAISSGSKPLGCTKLPIQCSQVYQLVIGFLVRKGDEVRLLVATLNGGAPAIASPVQLASDSPFFAAFDTFRLY